MAGVNKVILIGNLGADPETRQTQSGPVCNMRVATTERWTSQDGQKQERTEWHTVVVWGRQAENCQRYLAKGKPVYIEGSLRSRTYTDQEGKERRVWDVQAQTIQFLGEGRGEGGDAPQRDDGNRAQGGDGRGSRPAPQGGGGGWGNPGGSGGGGWGNPTGGGSGGVDDDDPIPF